VGTSTRPGHSVMASPRSEAIRVAVLVESLVVPEWVAWTIGRIDTDDAFELAAVVPAAAVASPSATGGSTAGAHDVTYRLYEWCDRRVFGPPRGMRHVDLSSISARQARFAAARALDVVVSFLPADRTVWDGPAPRHGEIGRAHV